MTVPVATRPPPDQELVDIAEYVVNFVPSREALDAARFSLLDTPAWALDAVDFPSAPRCWGP